MVANSPLLAFLGERLGGWGPVRAKRMFGAVGLFREGLMFAIIANEVLFLKTDAENRPAYEAAGSAPLRYDSARGEVALSYYEAPTEALDDPDALLAWVESAYGAARRSAARSRPRKPRSGGAPWGARRSRPR